MTKKTDRLNREIRRLDPVEPGELDRTGESDDAAELLERIVSSGHEPAGSPRRARRGLMPRLALTAGAVAAVAAAVLVLVLGLPGGDGDDGLASLDQAAATAGSRPTATTAQPYTYLKTREMSVSTAGADRRSWKVLHSTTREEWVTRDGAGRLRIVDGPARFVDAGDRAEWEGAGEPRFLTLGFGRRTEDRWVDAAMLRGGPEELSPDPNTLSARLRAMAEVEHGETPVDAAILGLIAERLRDPGASPALRRALYVAIKRVPGIEYLGEETDPAGRHGVAVAVSSSAAGTPTRYSLIFDPDTSQVLATETTEPARHGAAARPTLLKARVYLKARATRSLTGSDGAWISGFDPSTAVDRSFLIYRIPDLGAS